MKVHLYKKKNKKSINEKTKITISFRSNRQIPLLMIIREYYDKTTNEIVFAEILFEIE